MKLEIRTHKACYSVRRVGEESPLVRIDYMRGRLWYARWVVWSVCPPEIIQFKHFQEALEFAEKVLEEKVLEQLT